MGNFISGLATPSLINIEEYLSELPQLQFDEELLGSRLFKVAKAKRSRNGLLQAVVLKVFPCSNAKELLTVYRPVISAHCSPRSLGYNLLSFTVQVSSNERNIMLVRDFIDQSLVDRLCTRPFLSIDEKRWIAFQLLQALSQLHSVKPDGENLILCHGDIKAENVLLTSWGWLLLSDPAPFKPCWLPIDNPSEFTHFFDSSRRRACYLAPERFIDAPKLPHVTPVEGSEGSPQSTAVLITSDSGLDSSSTGDGIAVDLNGNPKRLQQPLRVQSDESLRRKRNASDNTNNLGEGGSNTGRSLANLRQYEPFLTPSMDLFSTGCVLLEMLTDGSVAFTLADLLAYRNGNDDRAAKLLKSISCEHLQFVVSNLLSLNSSSRISAEQHLIDQRGKAFPEVFYSHLREYMQTFLNTNLRNPTMRIAYIRRTLPILLEDLKAQCPESLTTCAVLLCNLVTSVLKPGGPMFVTQTPDTVATSDRITDPMSSPDIVTLSADPTNSFMPESSDNRLLECGKIDALVCYLHLYQHFPRPLAFDRIVPYCVDLTASVHSGEVRCLAVEVLAQILHDATSDSVIPAVEISFLTEYLFPSLAPLSVDPREEIRLTYARYLPVFMESAQRFLQSNLLCTDRASVEKSTDTLRATTTSHIDATSTPLSDRELLDAQDSSLAILRSHVQERLADLDKAVRYALALPDGGLAKLAAFFGRSHTSGTLLPHLITFVNDKDDPGMRTSFYRQVVHLVGLIGAQSISLFRPLLEEGLKDPNEMVIEVCLNSLSQLVRHRLLSPPLGVQFLPPCLALTSHPSNRIRQSAVGFIAMLVRQATAHRKHDSGSPKLERLPGHFSGMWTSSGIHARLSNAVSARSFFRRRIRGSFTQDAVLLSALRSPVPRQIIDTLIASIVSSNFTSQTGEKRSPSALLEELLQFLSEREASRAITRSEENPCYANSSSEFISNIMTRLQSLGLTERMEVQLLHLRPHLHALCDTWREASRSASRSNKPLNVTPSVRARLLDSQATPVSLPKSVEFTAWRLEHGSPSLAHLASSLRSGICHYEDSLCQAILSGKLPITTNPPRKGSSFARGISVDSTALQSVDPVVSQTGNHYGPSDRTLSTGTGDRSRIFAGFPQGKQLAHLHEHSAGHVNVAVHTSGRLMASCSSGDGTVKLWNFGSWSVELDAHLASSPNSDSHGNKGIGSSKMAGFVQRQTLPTRSSWTYSATGPGDELRKCRGLLWTTNGTSLATLVGNRWLHLIDSHSGRRCGLTDLLLGRDSGRVVCVVGPSLAQYPTSLTQGSFVGSTDTNVVAYNTTDNRILGTDLRLPPSSPPAWVIKQDKNSGLIRSLALHSSHTWLVSGSSRGNLTCWDLRYQRPAVCVRCTSALQPSIVNLTFSEWRSGQNVAPPAAERSVDVLSQQRILLVSATDRNHELCIWDLEAAATASSASRNGNPTSSPESLVAVDDGGLVARFQSPLAGHCPVRSVMCLPTAGGNTNKPLPCLVTGAKDGRIRSLDFAQSSYRVAAFGEADGQPPPVVTYDEHHANGVLSIVETETAVSPDKLTYTVQSSGLLVANRLRTADATQKRTLVSETFPAEGSLKIRQPAFGHGNVVSDLGLLCPSQHLLVSAAMDGVIKVWQ